MQDTKIDNTTVQLVDVIPQQTVTTTVNVANLIARKTQLVKMQADSNARFDAQIKDITDSLERASKLGIVISA